jgi:chromosome partitioning protein
MIIAAINNKGGTGKTTTCVSIAAALAAKGYKVLIADLDAQASASLSMGIHFDDLSPSAADVLFDDVPIASAIREAIEPNIDLLTGQMDLANSDLILSEVRGRENRLSESLAPVRDRYDFIVCDCPPSLSTISVNALMAADYFIIPMTAEYLALEGLISMMDAIDRIKRGMGVNPQLLGIVFTMVVPGLNLTREIMGLVRGEYGPKVFKTEIKRNVKLGEAPSRGKSIFAYAAKSLGAKSYDALAEEIIRRIGEIPERKAD